MTENLKEILKKTSYETGPDSLLRDFYIPALSCAKLYDRSVGYFSSALLISACQGLSGLIKSGGKMRLIIGSPLKDEEYEALQLSQDVDFISDELKARVLSLLNGGEGALATYRLQLFAWMAAIGTLEIKFAFRKDGIYHKKIGVIYDHDGNKVAFRGSANETYNAMDESKNAEEITLFPGWKSEVFEEYGQILEEEFHNLWHQGRHHDTFTVTMPSRIYRDIAESVQGDLRPDLELETKYAREEYIARQALYHDYDSQPFIPSLLGEHKLKMKEHQLLALRKWQSNEGQGILKLATGSGKTITSIYGAVQIYKKIERLALVVAVPYNELAQQWIENLSLFGIRPHKCFDARSTWYDSLKSDAQAFSIGSSNFLAVVVINRTMTSSAFSEVLGIVDSRDLLFIGDECHRHGSITNYNSLPKANFKMGLSATPFRDDDDEIETPFPDENKTRLLKYYGDIVAEYSLQQAINDEVLTPYEYYVCGARLTEDEQDLYEDLSARIINTINIVGEEDSAAQNHALTILCAQRSRLLGSAENKNFVLKEMLSKIPLDERRNSLFYCAEGKSESGAKNIDLVSGILNEAGWRTSQFTSNEPAGIRKDLLSSFSLGGIDALVSMKVLDEGIDIPACTSAFIMASSKNPRQYVQRRGRILRRAEGKLYARIYDFVVLPAIGREKSKYSQNLLDSEMERIDDFLLLAKNKKRIYDDLNKLGIKR